MSFRMEDLLVLQGGTVPRGLWEDCQETGHQDLRGEHHGAGGVSKLWPTGQIWPPTCFCK